MSAAPYPRLLTIILLTLGSSLCAVALLAAGRIILVNHESTVIAETSTREARTSKRPTLVQTQSKRTTNGTVPLSDTALVALLALGGTLILAGAFYARITAIAFSGTRIELQPAPQPTPWDRLAQAVLADFVVDRVAGRTS